jgi:hypothetical protein
LGSNDPLLVEQERMTRLSGSLPDLRGMRRKLVIVSAMLLPLCGAAALSAVRHGGSGKLTLQGSIGPLGIDRSTETDVIAFAGSPDARASGSTSLGHPGYVVLGYDCQEQLSRGLFWVDRFDSCHTVFYINDHTGHLDAFASSSRHYSFRGTRPGMSTRTAQAHIHTVPLAQCFPGFTLGFGHGQTRFWGDVEGGHDVKGPRQTTRIVGGHLAFFELESRRYPIGLLTRC